MKTLRLTVTPLVIPVGENCKLKLDTGQSCAPDGAVFGGHYHVPGLNSTTSSRKKVRFFNKVRCQENCTQESRGGKVYCAARIEVR